MYPNSARSLVTIVTGTDYTQPATYDNSHTYAAGDLVSYLPTTSPVYGTPTNYVSLVGSNTGHKPGTSPTFWAIQPQTAGYLPPIFALLCTGNTSGGAGNTVLKTVNGDSNTTIPSGTFVVGQEYSIYLAKLVTANGVSFVGYR